MGKKIGKGTQAEASENLYWRYESWIKIQERRLGSTVAASGELLAVRRAVYFFPDRHIINDDSHILLETIKQGYRVLYDPTAVTVEPGSSSLSEEYGRKSRTAAGRWQLARKVMKLAPSHPGFVFKFISHKLLRLLVMALMILAFASNLAVVLAKLPAESGIASLVKLSHPWGQLFLAPNPFVASDLAALMGVLAPPSPYQSWKTGTSGLATGMDSIAGLLGFLASQQGGGITGNAPNQTMMNLYNQYPGFPFKV